MHGTEDEEVDVSHGQGLYEALRPEARVAPWWVQGCGHNDIGEDDLTHTEYYQRLRDFLRQLDEEHRAIATQEPASMSESSRSGVRGTGSDMELGMESPVRG